MVVPRAYTEEYDANVNCDVVFIFLSLLPPQKIKDTLMGMGKLNKRVVVKTKMMQNKQDDKDN